MENSRILIEKEKKFRNVKQGTDIKGLVNSLASRIAQCLQFADKRYESLKIDSM